MAGGRKVYLLDEVHMLSGSAQNALLKTLEEPPPHIIFVLATTEAHKVQATIMSRCQRFDLKRIPMTATVARLRYICEQEGFTLDDESLEDIARTATGSLRDAVNALEQVVTYYGKSPSQEQVREALGITVDARSGQLARLLLEGDLTESLRLVGKVRDDGVDIKQFNRQLVKYLRGMLLTKAGATESLELPAEMAAEVKEYSHDVAKAEIIRALSTFGRIDFKEDTLSSLPLELAVVEFVSAIEEADVRPAPVTPHQEGKPQREAPLPAPTGRAEVQERKSDAVPEPRKPVAAAKPANGDLISQVRSAARDKKDVTLDALLNGSCEIVSLEGDKLVLGFYHTFHLERAESGSTKAGLEKAFSEALARPVSIKLEHLPREPRGKPKGGHLVETARQLGAKDRPREQQS
jgi:DNA polymerase-3 subunit gamma/tau